MRYHQNSETLRRVQRVRQARRQGAYGITRGDAAPRGTIQETSGGEPEQTRAEEEGQAFRFGPRFKWPFELGHHLFCWLARQLGVGKALANNLANQITEAVTILHRLAVIEAKRLFVNVAEQVKRLDAHIGAVQCALKQAPKVLQAVGMDVSDYVGFRMVDNVVDVVSLKAKVGVQFVREHVTAFLNMLPDVRHERSVLGIGNDFRADLSAAFQHPLDANLTNVAPGLALHGALLASFVHVPRLAADVSFVDLNFTAKLAARLLILHSQPDAVEHKPCSLLGDADSTVEFPGGNTIPVAGDHPHGREPLVQTERGILEDGPKLDAELGFKMPRLALPDATGSDESYVCRATRRAYDSVRPPTRHKIVQAIVGIREVSYCFQECFGLSAFHKPILRRIA